VCSFDSLDHAVLVSILREKVHDNRFLRLIENLLQAGYLEAWQYHNTLSGSPQGAVVSPILANIYLSKLDHYVESTLVPQYTRGNRRRINPTWARLGEASRTLRLAGLPTEARRMRRQMQAVPSLDPQDPQYRRLRYTRYADDWLLGFSGPRHEAEEIKQQIGTFLHEHLKLELSDTKTLISHARTHAARFLGYEIVVLNNNRKLDGRGHRSINGQIGLRVPQDVMQHKRTRYLRHGKAIHRPELRNDAAFSIVAQYQQEYRGLVEYYRLAYNLHRLNQLKWVMERSLVQTLAQKLRISVRQVYRRYQTTLQTDQGPCVGLQVTVERENGKKPLVARWGGISLSRNMQANLNDSPLRICGPRTEGSAIHVMLDLRRSSREVVMADEELDGTDMVRELLGEGQCVAHQPGHTLAQGVVEPFDVIGFPGQFADRPVLRRRNHLLIHHILIRVKGRVLTVRLRHLGPQLLGTRVAAIAHVKHNDLAGLGIHGNPHPLFVGFLLDKAGQFIGFHLQSLDQHIVLTGDGLDMQMIRQRCKALDEKAQEPLEGNTYGTTDTS
jgi:hypothetical protein